MARLPGTTKTGGRVAGTPNKISGDLRAAIIESFEMAGGAEYLLKQSQENPTAYMSLMAKVIPKEVEMKVTGTQIFATSEDAKL
jgi:hypothetical protein